MNQEETYRSILKIEMNQECRPAAGASLGPRFGRLEFCVRCAGHDDEKLAEMTQQEVFPDWVEHLLSIIKLCDELEAMGLIETVGIDPVGGSKVRRMTAKGREHPELWAEKPKH